MKPFNERYKNNGYKKPTFDDFKKWYSKLPVGRKSSLEIATARDKKSGFDKNEIKNLAKNGSINSNITTHDIYLRYLKILGFNCSESVDEHIK